MKRIFILLSLLIILAGLAWTLIQKSNASEKGIVTADRNFSVKDIGSVDKIVIKQPKLQPIVFTQQNKTWILNDKYRVDPDVFINIETVLKNISLSFIPPKQATSNIMESISKNGIQVDIYTGDEKPSKIFFLGSDTKDGDGTYMVMSGSTQPYVMQLPGLVGGLRSRFEQPWYNYRDKTLFRYDTKTIRSIKVEYMTDNLSSFEITNGSNPTIKPLLNLPDNPSGAPNAQSLKYYIDQFSNMGTEGIINDIPEVDSLLTFEPNTILTITTQDGNQKQYKFYSYDYVVEGENNPVTQKEIYGINRQYIYTDFDNTLYSAQMRVIRRIFLGYKDFFKASN